MTERATINQTVQIGVETTPGTAVAALKKLQSISIEPSPHPELQTFRPIGGKFSTVAALGKEWTQASISGPGSYNDLTYLLASIISYAAPAQQGATDAYQWAFTMLQSNPDTIKTFTVEHGSRVRAGRFTYGLVTDLGLTINRDEVNVSGTMIGQAYEDGIRMSTNATYTLTADTSPPTEGTFTLTYSAQTTAAIDYDATPAEVEAALEALSTVGTGNVEVTATTAEGAGNLSVAGNVYTIEFINELGQGDRTLTGTFTTLTPSASIILAAGVEGVAPTELVEAPILPTQVDVYVDTSAASLGSTQLERALSTELALGSRYAAVWPLNSGLSGFAAHVETPPESTLKLLVEANSEGMAFLTPMRAGTSRFIRIQATGPTIESPYAYGFNLDVCGKVSDVSEFRDEDGVYAVEYTFTLAHDATWGKALKWTLVNEVASL